MSALERIKWDLEGEKLFETGLDQVVLYVKSTAGGYAAGVPWNGASDITESPSGAESNKSYSGNTTYIDLRSTEEFGATIEAFTYPDEFAVCDGSASPQEGLSIGQQTRRSFGLAYRTKIGNDVENEDLGYKLHIVYGCSAAPSEKARTTIGESPDPVKFSWELTTVPVPVKGLRPSAKLELDSTKVEPAKMKEIEDLLYGVDPVTEGTASPGVAGKLLMPDEIIAILSVGTGG